MRAEQLYGRLRGTESSVVLFVGNVVDTAFAVGGQVHYGPNSAAGSITRILGIDGTRPRESGETATVERYSDHGLLRRALACLPAAETAAAETIPDLIEAARRPGVARDLFLERAAAMGRVAATLIDLLDPEAVVIVDRGYGRVDGVEATYLRTVGEYSALCPDPAGVVGCSSFMGRVLEMAGAAVALHGVFRTPLSVHERKAV